MAMESDGRVARFETTVRPSEATEAYWLINRRGVLFFSAIFLVIPALCGFVLYREMTWTFVEWGIIVAFGYAAFMGCLIVVCGINCSRRSKANGPIKWVVTDDGIKIDDVNASVQLKWPGLKDFIATRSLILPRFKNTNRALIIPKRCLDEQALTTVNGLLSLHLSSRS